MKFAGHAALGDWCKTRPGQVIVCENDGATWLPFRHFRDIQSSTSAGHGKKISKEAIWLSDEHPVKTLPSGYSIRVFTMPADEDGWPLGWTDLRASATDRFRQWCDSHGNG
jgi:hypothetical protein